MYNIAIVGSKNRITVEILEVLEDINFAGNIYILDLEQDFDANKEDIVWGTDNNISNLEEDDYDQKPQSLKFQETYLHVHNYKEFDFNLVNYVCYLQDKQNISKIIDAVKKLDIVIIDNSSASFLDLESPLIIPEINKEVLDTKEDLTIVSNPHPSVIQLLLPLSLLHKELVVRRVVCSTYQSVSGQGNEGLSELFEQTRGIYAHKPIHKTKAIFSKQIAFNVIPHVGKFLETGETEDEHTLQLQANLILDKNMKINTTCVQVPVFIGNAMSVNIEFDFNTNEEEIRKVLSSAPDIISVVDYRVQEGYVTPIEVVGENKIFISRIRKDNTQNNTFNFWIVADNLRRCVALNIINIINALEQSQ